MANFQDYQEQPVTSQSLFNCKQEANESLQSYFRRFTSIKTQATNIPDIVVIEAAINGLRIGSCAEYFVRKPPQTIQELYSKIIEYSHVDNNLCQKRDEQNKTKAMASPLPRQPHEHFGGSAQRNYFGNSW